MDKYIEDILQNTENYAVHELLYVQNNFPDVQENDLLFRWALRIGGRDRMFERIRKLDDPVVKTSFAAAISSYKDQMKEEINTDKGAYVWGEMFPEDRDEMKLLIDGSEWAFRWAKNIGNVEEMENKIDIEFWQIKFDKEIKEDTNAKFVHDA